MSHTACEPTGPLPALLVAHDHEKTLMCSQYLGPGLGHWSPHSLGWDDVSGWWWHQGSSLSDTPPTVLCLQHICVPQPDCPKELRTFAFYLSNIGRDSPQGSFDCIQQYVSR